MPHQRKTVCKHGHDISTPESCYTHGGKRQCKKCKRLHSKKAAIAAARRDPRRSDHLTPGEVDAMLTRATQLEIAPPWVRHPQPWT